MSDCVFCRNLPKIVENDLAYALFDINPVSQGHALIIPKRHCQQLFELTTEEYTATFDLLKQMKGHIERNHTPDGYNVWVNCGQSAGQVVMHAHLHLIPRFYGVTLHIKEHLKGNIA